MSKRNCISTPEGYFLDLQQRLSEIPQREMARTGSHGDAEEGGTSLRRFRRLAPYFAYAASLVVAVLLGNALLKRTAVPVEDDGWTYVSYLADALDPDGAPMDESAWDEEEDGLSREDIINYLLADGISVEQLNYVSYEEGYQ